MPKDYSNLKDWALWYASLGMAVFPIWPRTKSPRTTNGFKDATTDPAQIEAWWNEQPYNIGIATGAMSGGLVIIDLDINEEKGINGYLVLKEWQLEHGTLPDTVQSITGRGGYHLLYRDTRPWNNRVGVREGVDIRGEGGYIVAPPSIHPNGKRYEWEQDPQEFTIAAVDQVVFDFICSAPKSLENRQRFEAPEEIPEGSRTDTLFKMVSSLVAKGLSDDAIKAAVRAENESKCNPPLSDQELEREVFPAIYRYEKGTAPYQGKEAAAKSKKSYPLEMKSAAVVEEKEASWLVTDYIPRGQITSLAGDGGSGKTTVWCSIAAAVSTGRIPFLLRGEIPVGFADRKPELVMFFSAEDSVEYVLKRRLRKNGANLDNILFIDIADDRFSEIKFNSSLLEQLLQKYRPALCIFDPIQAFVPDNIKMGDRNAMRSCMAPLIGYGEKYGTTFLIVMHSNKQSGVWGRKRIADSADIWDISRSVILVGETGENGMRYLSHEKSNYGPTGKTVLYSLDNETPRFLGYTHKKDKDYVKAAEYNSKQAPQRADAKSFIMDYLQNGEQETAALNAAALEFGFSKNTLSRAKTDLIKEGKIRSITRGNGKNKKGFTIPMRTSEMG